MISFIHRYLSYSLQTFYLRKAFKMNFKDILNKYITLLDTSYSELAKISGLGTSTLSRYRTGLRVPGYDSPSVSKIVRGFKDIGLSKGIVIDTAKLRSEINQSLNCNLTVDYETYINNINLLLHAVGIRSKQLAEAVSYDTSHISKILSCKRHPGNISAFTDAVTQLANEQIHLKDDPDINNAISVLINADPGRINDASYLKESISNWLRSGHIHMGDQPVGDLLKKVDSYNIFEYIDSSNFEHINIPEGSLHLPSIKAYYNYAGMREAEIDFLRVALNSPAPDELVLYSDMPMIVLLEDMDFQRKWIFLMAQLLKQDIHIHHIHNVNRPVNELITYVENTLPFYMTGKITPYYLSEYPDEIFHHMIKVSNSAALTGMTITGYHDNGRYTLNKNKADIIFYKTMAENLLSKAKPLMDIYRADKKREFSDHMLSLASFGKQTVISCSLPIYTISNTLFAKILRRCGLSQAEIASALRIEKIIRDHHLSFLERGNLHMDIPVCSKAEFDKNPQKLFLSEFFIDTECPYLYEEYLEHLEDTKKFAKEHDNVVLTFNDNPSFKNINITIVEGREVIVSKNTLPPIHFIISHPKMVTAFSTYVVQERPTAKA